MSVLDLVVMIAATAPGLAIAQSLPAYVAIESSVMVHNQIVRNTAGGTTQGMGWNTSGSGNALSTGRPWHQRPSYWLGPIPCWAAPCLLSWTIAALVLGSRGPRPRLRRLARGPGTAAGLAGYTEAACWIALALSGRWSAERNPGGRMGRALGWCWIAMALSTEVGIACFARNV